MSDAMADLFDCLSRLLRRSGMACGHKTPSVRLSIDTSAIRLLTTRPTHEDTNMPARFEFTVPEDRWGFEKSGVTFTDTMGVAQPMPADLAFAEDTSVPNDAIAEVRYSPRGTLVTRIIDNGVPGGSGQFVVTGNGGQILGIIAVTLGPVTGLQIATDNTPVTELLVDPDAAPAEPIPPVA